MHYGCILCLTKSVADREATPRTICVANLGEILTYRLSKQHPNKTLTAEQADLKLQSQCQQDMAGMAC